MDDMLKKFVAVVESGTFTQAAETLHISQPALSVAIAKLEKQTGSLLFERGGKHGLILTEAGKQVYTAALEHRRVDYDLFLQLGKLGKEKVPLRIGMIDSVAALMCAQDEPLRTLETWTELSLHVLHSSALRQSVKRSELDVAIVVADDKEDDKLEVAAVAQDALLMVCAPGEEKSMLQMIRGSLALPFLSYTKESTTYHVIEHALAKDSVRVEPVLYSTSPDTILAMVMRGRGAAMLPELLVKNNIKQGLLVALLVHNKPYRVTRRLHVVTLKGRKLPPRLAGLALAMREQLRAYMA